MDVLCNLCFYIKLVAKLYISVQMYYYFYYCWIAEKYPITGLQEEREKDFISNLFQIRQAHIKTRAN